MPESARIAVSDADIDAALARAREYAKYDRRVVKAAYSKATDRLRLVLDNGVTHTIPRRLMQGLADADERDLSRVQILGDGTGLLWPVLEVAHYVPALLQGVYGSEKWMTDLYKQRRKLKLVNASGNSRHRRPGARMLDKVEGGRMASASLDGRHRDKDGRIDEKRGDTLVRTLRKEYGEDFLPDWSSNAKLATVLRETDMSLTELVRQHRRGK
ncbi:MAG: DUF2442 domain-containing protein [Terracidiphilus sp.]